MNRVRGVLKKWLPSLNVTMVSSVQKNTEPKNYYPSHSNPGADWLTQLNFANNGAIFIKSTGRTQLCVQTLFGETQ